MINMDKKELQGKTSTASEYDSEFDSTRAFTKEELLDQKRQSKQQAESREIERSHL